MLFWVPATLFCLLCDERQILYLLCYYLSLWNALVKEIVIMTVLIYDQASLNIISMNTLS